MPDIIKEYLVHSWLRWGIGDTLISDEEHDDLHDNIVSNIDKLDSDYKKHFVEFYYESKEDTLHINLPYCLRLDAARRLEKFNQNLTP